MESAGDLEDWLVDANEAFSISLVSPSSSGLQKIATFHPKYTHSLFGDDEKIFGYKNLKLQLRYRANDMRPHLDVSYSKMFKPSKDAEALDIKELLQEGQHLPRIAFVSTSDFDNSSQQLGDSWTPPGTLHSSFRESDGEYEVWEGNLADPAVKQLNSRIQILIPLFIDGGSYIGSDPEGETAELDLSDANRWTLFFLYKKQKSSDDPAKNLYTFVGYATIYRFFYFQPPTPPATSKTDWELPISDMSFFDFSCRSRISQFLILPPFQGKGKGALLYRTVFEHYHKQPQTYEITVENPNEAFDDLRDVCDLAFLQSMPEFRALSLDTSVVVPRTGPVPHVVVGQEKLGEIRLKAKIALRQFSRVLEIYLMSNLPTSVRPKMTLEDNTATPTADENHQKKLWQLLVKQRLYRHNKEALVQMEVHERIEKLEETLPGVELEYARILDAYHSAAKHVEASANGKRKLEESPSTDEVEVPSKKTKVDV